MCRTNAHLRCTVTLTNDEVVPWASDRSNRHDILFPGFSFFARKVHELVPLAVRKGPFPIRYSTSVCNPRRTDGFTAEGHRHLCGGYGLASGNSHCRWRGWERRRRGTLRGEPEDAIVPRIRDPDIAGGIATDLLGLIEAVGPWRHIIDHHVERWLAENHVRQGAVWQGAGIGESEDSIVVRGTDPKCACGVEADPHGQR